MDPDQTPIIRRLIRIQAVKHTYNISTGDGSYRKKLKIEADENNADENIKAEGIVNDVLIHTGVQTLSVITNCVFFEMDDKEKHRVHASLFE